MTTPSPRRHGVGLALLALTTALVVELVRAAGPLLDRAFANGVVTVAVTALVTFALPGLILALFVVHRRVSGTVVLAAVAALALVRLVLQGLTEAVTAGAGLGGVRYAVGLGGVAVGLAALVLVAAFVGGSGEGEPGGARWTPGARVGLGTILGGLLAAGISLTLGTWDAFWRAGPWGWAPTVLLVAGVVAGAWLVRGQAPVTTVPRGLWLLGPALALSIQITANPAFLAAQSGVALPFGAFATAAAALLTAATVPVATRLTGTARRVVPAVSALLAAAGLAAAMLVPGRIDATPSWALLALGAVLTPLTAVLLATGLDRGPRPATWVRLAGTGTAVGLGTILPVLVFQIDYDVPLPVPNAWVPVATVLVLGVPGAWAALRTPGRVSAPGPVETAPEPASRAARRAARVRPPARSLGALAGVTALLAAVGAWQSHVPTTTNAAADYPPGTLRLLDWNLHYGVSADPGVRLDEIAAVIEDSGADVVLLQEVSRGWVLGGGADMGTYLARATGMRIAFVPAADRQFGNAILWDPLRGDLTDVARTALPYGDGPQQRSAITATIDAGGVPVRVTSIHLQHRDENTPTRTAQLSAFFTAEPVAGAFVLAGDFNAEPGSPEIRQVRAEGLASAQDEVGDPSTPTEPALDPVHRIDWVFGPAAVTFTDAAVLDSVASDHRPVLVELTAIP